MVITILSFLLSVSSAESLDKVRAGYDKFPLAECPSINKRYTELTEKLASLKQSIRDSTNCKDEKLSFEGLAKLVNDDREEFLRIAAKGATTNLTPEETQKLVNYVASVTKMGGQVTDLILGSHCFKDDQKNLITVEVVASLIAESTAALKNVRGPFGPLINMAGKVTSTLLLSLDKVVRSRTAYDFTNPEQRKVFIQTMCSYAGFRRELDEISRVDASIRDVKNAQLAYQQMLNDIYKACPECKALADEYIRDFHKGEAYVRGTMDSLREKFKAQADQADSRFVEAIGSQTIINLRSLVWAEDEIQRIDRNISDLGDVERDRVVQLQDVIENFLFEKWHPELVRYYLDQLEARLTKLRATAINSASDLGEVSSFTRFFSTTVGATMSRDFLPESLNPNHLDLIDVLFTGTGLNYRRAGLRSNLDLSIRLNGVQSEINRQLGEVVSAVVLIERNCEFVRAANLRYESTTQRLCGEDTLWSAYELLWHLRGTSHENSPIVKAIFDAPATTLYAWAEQKCIYLPTRDNIWVANPLQKATLLMNELRIKFPGFPLKPVNN